jgi:hypothetical protein
MPAKKAEEHVHDWSRWGFPYTVSEVKVSCQIRECRTCSIIQERTIGTYRVVSAYVDLNPVLH